MRSIYYSLDIETDGSVGGLNNMLSLGCVAFDPQTGEILATFTANLLPLPEYKPDPRTMEWWKQFPQAWAAATKDARPPADVMPEFELWVSQTAGGAKATACCWPSWDFSFVHLYLHKFAGGGHKTSCGCVFGHRALCIRTLASAALNHEFRGFGKRIMPKAWFPAAGADHTHVALEDALEQAYICIGALRTLEALHSYQPEVGGSK